MKEKKKNLYGILSLTAGLLLFFGILVITIFSLKTTGDCYTNLKNADLSQETESSLYYNDHLFASIGFGINILPNEAGNEARLSSFLSSSIREIDIRILNCCLLYSMMISVVLQYFLYSRYQSNRKKYFFAVCIAGIAPFAFFAAAVFCTQRAFGMPVVFPGSRERFLIAIGLLSVTAGNFVVGSVISAVRCKKLTAVLAVPVVFCLFIAGMNFEMHLYADSTVDSFAYFYDAHPEVKEDDFDGDLYYDEEKNVIFFNGAEYPPKSVDNPEYYTGLKRPGAFLFELADAYSGNGLLLTESITGENSIPLWAAAAYILKSAAWIALSFCLLRRHRTQDELR